MSYFGSYKSSIMLFEIKKTILNIINKYEKNNLYSLNIDLFNHSIMNLIYICDSQNNNAIEMLKDIQKIFPDYKKTETLNTEEIVKLQVEEYKIFLEKNKDTDIYILSQINEILKSISN